MEYMTPNFTKDMVKTHKILIPNMAVTQFRLMQAALASEGYQTEVLGNCGSEVAQLGLKYVHNDTCYPALLVIGQFLDALNSGNMDTVKDVLGNNTDSLAAALAAPVQVKRTAVFPVENFGSQLAPFYTILPLFVGSLLMAVTLKTTVSRKNREELDNPKPHQLFLGHYGVFAVIALLQSTFSLGGGLLFLHIQAVHPWLLTGWVASLVFSFFTYTMVASFGNVGKAIGVLTLVLQISGANGAYPLAVLPKIIGDISPFLPATHAITALRAAIAGIYNNDYWHAIGSLLLFLIPLLLIGLLLRIPLVKFNRWYVAKVESTKVVA